MTYDCGHDCCNQRFNESHSHRVESIDCTLCNIERYGAAFVMTEDETCPCVYCVQWHDVSELDAGPGLQVPYWPSGDVVPRVYNGVCDSCQEDLDKHAELNDEPGRGMARGDHDVAREDQRR